MYATLLWTSLHNFTKYGKPLVVYLILIHGIISLPDVTSYDKIYSNFLKPKCIEHIISHNPFKILYLLKTAWNQRSQLVLLEACANAIV